jgi:hypothetical protein
MEMIILVSLCIIAGAIIDAQYSSMRRIIRLRDEDNDRRRR